VVQIIVKPATVFGPEDRFLNNIAESSVRLPFTPLVNEGRSRLQPVYSVDVGRALVTLVNVRLGMSVSFVIYADGIVVIEH
jgi:hypothetical protein